MKVETGKLKGPSLNWAVATALGRDVYVDEDGDLVARDGIDELNWAEEWAEGGPVIERERLCVEPGEADIWTARQPWHGGAIEFGATMLEAAMRCFVASKLGDEVDIPDELAQ